jgi:hypothetical protein
MSAPLKVIPVTIPAGQSLSNGALVGDYRISGLQFPPVWAAGGISWQASLDDGATWVEVTDATGAPIAYPTAGAANTYFLLDSTKFVGLTLVRIRSGTLAAPVNQGANCVLRLACAKLNPLY